MAVLEVQRRTAWVGSNPDPTVVGMTITGGINWFGRRYGLGADSIVTVELVDGLGRLRMVTRPRTRSCSGRSAVAATTSGSSPGRSSHCTPPPRCTTVNDGDVAAQAIHNVKTVLAAAGMTLADVVRYDVHATDLHVYFMNGGHEQVAKRFGHVGTFPAGGIAAQVPALAVPGGRDHGDRGPLTPTVPRPGTPRVGERVRPARGLRRAAGCRRRQRPLRRGPRATVPGGAAA